MKMQTTKKQLINYAISIIKEVARTQKDIKVEYTNNIIWVVFDNGSDDGFMYLSKGNSIKENRLKYLEIIKRIKA
jgi:hypothetical protein